MGPKKSTFILEEIDLLILSTQMSHSSVIELADLTCAISFFPESVFPQFLNELFYQWYDAMYRICYNWHS